MSSVSLSNAYQLLGSNNLGSVPSKWVDLPLPFNVQIQSFGGPAPTVTSKKGLGPGDAAPGSQSPTSASTSSQGSKSGQSHPHTESPTEGASAAAAMPPTATPVAPAPLPPPRPAGPSTLWPTSHVLPFCDGSDTPTLTAPSDLLGTTWKGWGTSLAWFANYIGGLPENQLNPLLDLLFSPTGLHLNLVRYNIGGGFNPQYSPQLLKPATQTYVWRGMPGFKATADAGYNWTADYRQTAVLVGAKQRGVNEFQAFSNSPPWWMTKTKDVAGSDSGGSNFQVNMTNEFAVYLAEVLQHYRDDPSINITFRTLEPFNEPSRGWKRGGNQEGCRFDISDMQAVIPAVQGALGSRGLSTQIASADDWLSDTSYHITSLPMDSLTVINAHDYVDPGNTAKSDNKTDAAVQSIGLLNAVRKVAGSKEVWISEWGPMYHSGEQLDLALFMARRIVESVNYLQISAWTYWQVFDTHDDWTVIKMDWTSPNPLSTVQLTKKFFVLRQFTLAGRPGSKPLELLAPFGHSVTMFYNEGAKELGIVLVNQQSDDSELQLTLPSQWQVNVGGTSGVQMWRTSPWEDCKRVKYRGGAQPFQLVSPGRSVTTFVVSHVGRSS